MGRFLPPTTTTKALQTSRDTAEPAVDWLRRLLAVDDAPHHNPTMARDTVTVLLFARYAELFGTSAIDLPAPAATTVGGIVEYLRTLPGGGTLPERPLVAVNMHQAAYDRPVLAGDEVALLPPMAGG